MTVERLFARLPPGTRPGDVVRLDDGRIAVVETVKLASDLRDAKCVVVEVVAEEGGVADDDW